MTTATSPNLILPKFHTAYSDIENRIITRRKLTFGIEKIDSSISLSAADCLCIVGRGERKYANALLMRLCVRALSKRQQSCGLKESTKVIFIDAGGRSSDIYQCVNFARQYYGLDIKKILRNIMVTRAFTIYQLADSIIYQLPKFIQQFNCGKVIVVVIADLLNLFTQDPNIDHNEAIFLIKEIISSIKKTLDNTLVVITFQQYNNKSNIYHKILLPRFDKLIEIANTNSISKINLLDVNVYGNNRSKNRCNTSLLLEKRDILQIIPDPTS